MDKVINQPPGQAMSESISQPLIQSTGQPVDPQSADLLAALRDIKLPPDPGWWPPAPGWWLLGFLVLLIAGLMTRSSLKIYKRRRPYREFRQALDALPVDPGAAASSLRAMSTLTRRLVVTQLGREQVASLTGDEWLRLLDSLSNSNEFSAGSGKILAQGPYRATVETDLHGLKKALMLLAR